MLSRPERFGAAVSGTDTQRDAECQEKGFLRWRFKTLRHPQNSILDSSFSIAEAPITFGLRSACPAQAPNPGAFGMSVPRLITFEGLAAKGITLGKQRIWQLEQEGKFPQRVSTSPGRHAWVESEIEDYLAAKIAERNARR
jgi:prophage regulatory protein